MYNTEIGYLIWRQYEVNDRHAEQFAKSLKADLKTIEAFLKKNAKRGSDVQIRHLCSSSGTSLYGITVGNEKHLVPCAYRLELVGAAWSSSVWFRCYVAQLRLIEYLHAVKNEFAGFGNWSIEFDDSRHLYAAVILRNLERDMGRTEEYRYQIYTHEEYEYMKAHLEIYKRRFPAIINHLMKHTTKERISGGFMDFYEYYNDGYLKELKAYQNDKAGHLYQ